MGECCTHLKEKDDLFEEIRRDAKISQYETKGNNNESDFLRVLSIPSKENIVFEVQDNPLIDFSKGIFDLLNLIRTNSKVALNFSKKYGLENIMNDLIVVNNRPPLMDWSSKKSRFISDYFQNPKNSFKSTKSKVMEIQEKYKEGYNVSVFQVKSAKNNSELCISGLLKKLDKEGLNVLLNDIFEICIIYSEIVCNYTFADVVNQKDVNSYFFFFQKKKENNEQE